MKGAGSENEVRESGATIRDKAKKTLREYGNKVVTLIKRRDAALELKSAVDNAKKAITDLGLLSGDAVDLFLQNPYSYIKGVLSHV